MTLSRLQPRPEKRGVSNRVTSARRLLRPVNLMVLAAGLAAGALLAFLTPQPVPAASAQEPADPVCGNNVCEPPVEQYTNCADCLSSCSWCTDQAFCENIQPEEEWFFVPGFSGCSTQGCCIHIPPPDGTPPVTTALADGTLGLAGWYVSPVTVTLVATDDQSGVYSTNLDGTPYSGPRLYQAEGATTITYQSYDNASNLEPLKSTTFYIDTVAPQSMVATPAESGKWFHGQLALAGVSFDETSGLAGVEISLDGGTTWQPATGGEVWALSWNTQGFADGMYGVRVRGSDQAGNVETPLSIDIGVDNSGPFFNVGPFPGEHCFGCSGPVTFSLTAFDDQSHIANSAVVVKKDGKDVRVLKAPTGELRGVPIVWDGLDDHGRPLPPGDYQLLFYTANQAGLFGSYGAGLRVTDALPAAPPVPAPLAPADPPEHTPWIMTPMPPTPASTSGEGADAVSAAPQQAAITSQAGIDPILSLLGGASGGTSGRNTGAAGAGAAALLTLAAAYIAARQSSGDGTLGKQLAGLASQFHPKEKPAAPPAPRVAPPQAPPPPPPSPPRPKPLRWDDIPRLVPAEPEPPRYYAPPPKPKPQPIPYYALPWLPKPKPQPIPTYALPWLFPRPKPKPAPSGPQPIPYAARPWAPPPPPIPTYARPWLPPRPQPVVDMRALEREIERQRLHKSLEENQNLNWFQKTAAGLLGEATLALDAFDQYVAPKVKETGQAIADTGKKIQDYYKERERKREKLRQELDKTDLPAWKKGLVVSLTDINTSLGDFDKGIGQHIRPGLTRATHHAGEDIQKVLGWAPLAPGETRGEAATRLVAVDGLDMLTLGLFRTEAGKQIAVSMLTGMKESVDLTSHNSRMLVGLEELDEGVTRWEAAGEALYGASTIMTLGGTADIREGIEEGDPVKVTMGVFQTLSMLALVGAASSSIKAGGLKLIGAIDDVAYKEAMTLARTAMTAGEAADALSGGVQALEGIATGNPLAAIAGLASIGMADLPPGATKKVIGEAVEEGLEKVTKETVEELTEEGVEKIAREAVEDVAEEAIEHTTREAVEQATGQTVKDVAEEAGEAVGKQTDEVIGETAILPSKTIEEPEVQHQLINRTENLEQTTSERINTSIDNVSDAIDSVHSTTDMPDIEVISDPELDKIAKDEAVVGGQYRRYKDRSKPPQIAINPNSPLTDAYLPHEAGHYIDDYGFGVKNPETGYWEYGSASFDKDYFTESTEVKEAYETLFKEIKDSHTYRQIMDGRTRALKFSDDELIEKIDNYFASNPELFARGYAQYVALRSGNTEILEQLVRLPDFYTMPMQWRTSDFTRIADAFDALLRAKGWIQ